MSMKSLRAQSKASGTGRLSRIVGRATGGKVADTDDGKIVTKKRKPFEAMAPVEGKAARPRLDRPGRKMGGRIKRAAGGGLEDARPDDDGAVEKAGWLDRGASIASRLIRGGAKPAAKAIEDTGGASGQRIRDLMDKGKSFGDAHREVHPELYKGNAERTEKMKQAVEANTAAKAAGKPYPSEEWKALFTPEKKTGGRVKR